MRQIIREAVVGILVLACIIVGVAYLTGGLDIVEAKKKNKKPKTQISVTQQQREYVEVSFEIVEEQLKDVIDDLKELKLEMFELMEVDK